MCQADVYSPNRDQTSFYALLPRTHHHLPFSLAHRTTFWEGRTGCRMGGYLSVRYFPSPLATLLALIFIFFRCNRIGPGVKSCLFCLILARSCVLMEKAFRFTLTSELQNLAERESLFRII